jgi:hypothetical protein
MNRTQSTSHRHCAGCMQPSCTQPQAIPSLRRLFSTPSKPSPALIPLTRHFTLVFLILVSALSLFTLPALAAGEATPYPAGESLQSAAPAAAPAVQATPAPVSPAVEIGQATASVTASDQGVNIPWPAIIQYGITIVLTVITSIIGVLAVLNNKFVAVDKLASDALARAGDAIAKSSEAVVKAGHAEEFSRDAKSAAVEAASHIKTARDLADEALKSNQASSRQFEALEDRFNELNELTRSSLRPVIRERARKSSMKEVYEAFDNGEISRDEFIEEQQLMHWRKWIYRRNPDGYRELMESARQDNGLTPPVRTLAREEILRLQEKERNSDGLSKSEQALKSQLVTLLKIKPG